MDAGQERVYRFFLQEDGSAVPGYSSGPRVITPHRSNIELDECVAYSRAGENIQKLPSRTFSTNSTVSSVSISCPSDISSHRSSPSTVTSSITSMPPWQTLDQQISLTPYDPGYDLQCEFAFVGCEIKFLPSHFEEWIEHSISHFKHLPPPPKATCTFCDDQNSLFQSQGDAREMWRQRMIHIGYHFRDLQSYEETRPDYFLLEYLTDNNLISSEDYTHAIKYTERPHCDGLVPYGFETREMKESKDRDQQEPYDLEKERRQKRREDKRGKHNKMHKYSTIPETS